MSGTGPARSPEPPIGSEEDATEARRSRTDRRDASIRAALRHPLTSLVLGFALTGYMGSCIAAQFQARQKKAERDADAREQNRRAALAVTDSVNRYVLHGFLRVVEALPGLTGYERTAIFVTPELEVRRRKVRAESLYTLATWSFDSLRRRSLPAEALICVYLGPTSRIAFDSLLNSFQDALSAERTYLERVSERHSTWEQVLRSGIRDSLRIAEDKERTSTARLAAVSSVKSLNQRLYAFIFATADRIRGLDSPQPGDSNRETCEHPTAIRDTER
jgi:hypothetical protein